MSFEIRADGVDVAALLRQIQAQIDQKKHGLYTEAELREIVDHRLEPVLDAHDVKSTLLGEIQAQPSRWNFAFDPGSVYRSSHGLAGRMLERVRALLAPVQKLFWNPNPMISALCRQADLNASYLQLLHNLVLEVTRLNLEVQELKSRALHLQGRLEQQARREKALEAILLEHTQDAPETSD